MKGKIYGLLNLLVSISGEKVDTDLVNKKNNLVDNIDATRKKINELTVLMDTDRYFDENAELLDKNTVIALQNKVKTLQKDADILKADIKKVVEEEKFYSEKINLGKLNVEKYAELLKNISYKLVDKNANIEYYDLLLNKNSEKLDYWNNFVRKLEKEVESKNINSSVLKSSKENFDYEIKNLKERINEINHSLENELNYYNRALKDQDEKTLENLNKKVEKLEKEYDNLVDSVSYLALEFIDLVDNESYIYARSKLNEIIWRLEYIPHVLDTDFESLENSLKVMKKEKNNIKEKISNNDYLNESSKILRTRIKDINYFLEDNKRQIIEVKKLINYIDKEKCFELSSKINDLDMPEEMIANYNSDLNHLIEYSIILKNTSLKYLENYRKRLNEELDDISKKIALKDGLIDEEKKLEDIEAIKDLTKNIDYINHRLDNKINVYEVRDNIEMLLDSIDFDFVAVEKEVEEELVFLKVIKIKSLTNKLYDDDIIDLTGV